VLSLGSLITEGQHIYLDRENPKWSQAMVLLLNKLTEIKEEFQASMTVLRDFEESDLELKSLFLSEGYFKVAMPESCQIDSLDFNNEEDFLANLSFNSRKHVKREVLRYQDELKVEFKDVLDKEEQKAFYRMYREVVNHNFDLNTFYYPERLIKDLQGDSNWKFIVIKGKMDDLNDVPMAISANYLNSHNLLTGVFLGMDYQFLETHKIYKQVLYQTIMLGKALHCPKVYLGFSAAIDKRKFGANLYPKCAFLQTNDNYKLELLENLRG
jgi:predicted N-acyltransferase